MGYRCVLQQKGCCALKLCPSDNFSMPFSKELYKPSLATTVYSGFY